ncbi:hypothetical protein RCJ22_16395 [Vibrio sp. FNV 38]|nr:hypothetical protein [Vibrio sp. FNV 38]
MKYTIYLLLILISGCKSESIVSVGLNPDNLPEISPEHPIFTPGRDEGIPIQPPIDGEGEDKPVVPDIPVKPPEVGPEHPIQPPGKDEGVPIQPPIDGEGEDKPVVPDIPVKPPEVEPELPIEPPGKDEGVPIQPPIDGEGEDKPVVPDIPVKPPEVEPELLIQPPSKDEGVPIQPPIDGEGEDKPVVPDIPVKPPEVEPELPIQPPNRDEGVPIQPPTDRDGKDKEDGEDGEDDIEIMHCSAWNQHYLNIGAYERTTMLVNQCGVKLFEDHTYTMDTFVGRNINGVSEAYTVSYRAIADDLSTVQVEFLTNRETQEPSFSRYSYLERCVDLDGNEHPTTIKTYMNQNISSQYVDVVMVELDKHCMEVERISERYIGGEENYDFYTSFLDTELHNKIKDQAVYLSVEL